MNEEGDEILIEVLSESARPEFLKGRRLAAACTERLEPAILRRRFQGQSGEVSAKRGDSERQRDRIFKSQSTQMRHGYSDGKMELKYEDKLAAIPGCPSADAQPGTRKSYRWVNLPIEQVDNFRPTARRQPARLNAKNDAKRCSLWALSFFVSLKQAEERFLVIVKDRPLLRKQLGEYVAEGVLKLTDGLMTQPNSKGHFELHESKQANLVSRFTVIKKIP